MSRILLVDDQREVVAGLRALLDSLFVDTEILEAHGGAQGYALALESLPDLIIADIMMPGVDGLQMIHRLRRDGLKSRVVILSAHEEFEYARKAIALGVEDYIVKPVTRRELFVTVGRQLRAIENEAGRDLYCDVLLNEYLSGADIFLPEGAVFDMSGLSAMEQPLWCIALYQSDKKQPPGTLATLLLDMEALLSGQGLAAYLYHTYSQCIFVLLNLAGEAREEGASALRVLGESLPPGFHAGISAIGEGLPSLCTLYRQAEIAANNAARMAAPFAAYEDSATEGAVIGHDAVGQLIDALRAQDRLQAWTILDKLLARLTLQGAPIDACRAELSSLIRAMDALFCQDADDLPQVLSSIETADSLFALKRIVHARAAKWLLAQEDGVREGYPPAISAAADHIRGHLGENMTVAQLANIANLSYYYFSALFTRSTGMTVREFILHERLSHAAMLLRRDGALRIGEVAQLCGFENVRYFSSCFKRKYQQTPQQYRSNA